MNKIFVQLLCLSVLLVTLWFLPDLVGSELNHIILACIAGWQLGDWAYKLGDKLTQ